MDDSPSSGLAFASQIDALRTQLTIAIGRTQLLRRGLASEPAAGELDGHLATIEWALFRLARSADRAEELRGQWAPPPGAEKDGRRGH